MALDSTFEPPMLHATAARALELAALTAEADEALAAGDLDAARAGYVAALEQAPRHPELTQLIGEIDLFAGGRAEAALGPDRRDASSVALGLGRGRAIGPHG